MGELLKDGPSSVSLSISSTVTAYSLNFLSILDVPIPNASCSPDPNSRSNAKNVPIPSALLTIAGVSPKGASNLNRLRFDGPGVCLPGLDCLEVEGMETERCLECPFTKMPFGLDDRCGGMGGSVRSLRSVIFLSSFSDLALSRLAHRRRGWFCASSVSGHNRVPIHSELTSVALYV